jgi:hypothetical protein
MIELLENKKGPIYTLTLNRPEKRNALPFEMLRDILKSGMPCPLKCSGTSAGKLKTRSSTPR